MVAIAIVDHACTKVDSAVLDLDKTTLEADANVRARIVSRRPGPILSAQHGLFQPQRLLTHAALSCHPTHDVGVGIGARLQRGPLIKCSLSSSYLTGVGRANHRHGNLDNLGGRPFG